MKASFLKDSKHFMIIFSPYLLSKFSLTTLRTLDVSKNKLQTLGDKIDTLSNLKSLNCDENKLTATAIQNITKLSKLQTLSMGTNRLGNEVVTDPKSKPKLIPLPNLPPSLKNLKLNSNSFMSIPPSIYSAPNPLIKLEKLDLSDNNLAAIPEGIQNLVSLVELNLDQNTIIAVPESVGKLSKLKALSLRRNQIRVEKNTVFSDQNPQPIHPSVFTDTLVVDLNLDGNAMTSTQLNVFEGFDAFLGKSFPKCFFDHNSVCIVLKCMFSI